MEATMVGILFLFGVWVGVAASTILIAAFVFHRELNGCGERAGSDPAARKRGRGDLEAAPGGLRPKDHAASR
jgi:hypothetical protein